MSKNCTTFAVQINKKHKQMDIIHRISDNTYVRVSPDELYGPRTWKGFYAFVFGLIAASAVMGLLLLIMAKAATFFIF